MAAANYDLERDLPASVDAERAILGAILLDNAAYPEAAGALRPDDFSLDSHRRIFARMVELGESGKPIDIITLTSELGRHREVEIVGGVPYLGNLTEIWGTRQFVHVAGIASYLRTVKEKAASRELINVCNGAIAEALDQQSPASETIARLGDRLLDISADQKQEGPVALAEFTIPALDNVLTLRKRRDGLLGLDYGVPCLNKATTGIRDKEFVIIGARPKQGKTALSVQIAAANAQNGIPVGVFSLEMTREQWYHRLWAIAGQFPFYKIRDPRLMTDEDERRLTEIAAMTAEWPIYIDDSGALSPEQINARARLLVKRKKAGLIIVDFVQRVGGRGRDLRERVSHVADRLCVIAKDLVPVVALSQLARNKDHNESEPPNMQDLKETGNLEQNAHVVILPFRPKVNGDFTGEDELIIAAQRSGAAGPNAAAFDDKTLSFRDRWTGGGGYDSKAAQAGGSE